MREMTFVTFPLRIQEVQTRILLVPVSVLTRTRCKLGSQRRFVCLSDGLILLPVRGLLPHIVQTLDIFLNPYI